MKLVAEEEKEEHGGYGKKGRTSRGKTESREEVTKAKTRSLEETKKKEQREENK